MTTELIKRTDFALIADVTRGAITRACRPGGILAPACDGRRIDVAHPAAVAYITDKTGHPPPTALVMPEKPPHKNKRPKPVADTDGGMIEIPEDIQIYADMSLREIIERFGTMTAFNDHLAAIQKIEVINEKRLKNAQTEGVLVGREVVRTRILDPMETMCTKLLTDCAKTLSVRVPARYNAGDTPAQIEKQIADALGTHIKQMKTKVARAIRAMDKAADSEA